MIRNKTHIYFCAATFDMIDMSGVLHHPQYLVICERARLQGLREAGYPFQELLKTGNALVIRNIECNYYKPVFLDNELVVLTQTESIDGQRIHLVQKFILASEFRSEWLDQTFIGSDQLGEAEYPVIFQVKLTMVSVSLSPIRPVRIPEQFLKQLGYD